MFAISHYGKCDPKLEITEEEKHGNLSHSILYRGVNVSTNIFILQNQFPQETHRVRQSLQPQK